MTKIISPRFSNTTNTKSMKTLLTIILFFLLLTGSVNAGTYSGGSGTSGSPYQIASLNDLQELSTTSGDWGAYFIQTADIDASATSGWNSGAGFSPIGNITTKFTGSYDGGSYAIDGLYINTSSDYYWGLFGYTDGASIADLGLTSANITGYSTVGALAGQTDNSMVSNCYSSGAINATEKAGGLVGINDGSSNINNCYSSCTVTTSANVSGGIVGLNDATINSCYSTGDVTGQDYTGGLVGNSFGSIIKSYSTADLDGRNYCGGLVGYCFSYAIISDSYSFADVSSSGHTAGGLIGYCQSNVTISNCYSIGSVSGSTVGGFIGSNSSGSISNCFWDEDASGTSSPVGGGSAPGITGKTTAEMKTESTFSSVGWDFTSGTGVWKIESNVKRKGYPHLEWENIIEKVAVAPTQDNGVYLISSLDELRWIAEDETRWSYNYRQTANIDASETSTWWGGSDGSVNYGHLPIGNSSANFTGSYDGDGHTIDGLYINRSSESKIGLFGTMNGASLTDLGLTNVNITGSYYTGGLIGYSIYSSSVSNCYSSGTVSGVERVGGLVGANLYSSSSVSNCYSSCNVTASGNYSGGLVGDNGYSATISNSYSTGNVTGSYYVGGLTGFATTSAIISNCFSTGTVTGNYAGGLVGTIGNSQVSNCYSTGSVTTGSNRGGLIGYNTSSTVTNSFWDTETSGHSSSAGGTGKTTAEMKALSTFTNATWDFQDETGNGTNDYWGMNIVDNNGYPFLSWQGFTNREVCSWTGSTDTDWSTAGNWGDNAVPISSTDVRIPAGISNYPTIGASTTVSCNNLTVESGGSMTLESDASNTASLLINGACSGSLTAERYMTGAATGWHLVGVPVSGQSINDLVTDAGNSFSTSSTKYGLGIYNEATDTWTTYTTTTAPAAGNLSPGTGYETNRSADGKISFTGSPTVAQVDVSVTRNGNGWNLVGNPYTCALYTNANAHASNNFISVNTAALDDAFEAIYIWNASSDRYEIINQSSAASYIPSGQGFFIKAAAAGTISFTLSMRTHQTGATFKTSVTSPRIIVKANNGEERRSTEFRFIEGTSIGLDPGYDAGLFNGNVSGFQFYSKLMQDNKVAYALQCLPTENYDTNEIPLEFYATTNKIEFSADLSDIPENVSVYLEDRLHNTFVKLGGEDQTYSTPVETGTVKNRFYLHTSSQQPGQTELSSTKNYRIIPDAKASNIRIKGGLNKIDRLEIYDLSGRLVYKTLLNNTEVIRLPEFGNGLYIVKLYGEDVDFSQKISWID